MTPPETSTDEFRAAADFCEKYPEAVSAEERDVLKGQFFNLASVTLPIWDHDPDWLRDIVADLEYVGERLNVDAKEFAQRLAERADEIESERELEPPEDYEGGWESSDFRIDDVQAMFDGLESDLRDG